MLSRVYVKSYGLDIVMTRSFNHIGPLQDTRFVVPGFITRILKIKQKGMKEGTIETGDLSITRDFVDVNMYYNSHNTVPYHLVFSPVESLASS